MPLEQHSDYPGRSGASRRLCNWRDVLWALLLASPARSPPIYGPRAFFSRWRWHLFGGRPFKGERYLLRCDDFFLGMYPFWKPSSYLKQSSCYNQVLTGVLPYRSDGVNIVTEIQAGKRPSRPIDPSQSRSLQDPVWNVIRTGWRNRPRRRCELSVMYRVFSGLPPSQRRQLGKFFPQVASFFQFLQNSGSEIQRQVDEMNQVLSSTSPLPKSDTIHSVLRTAPCRIGSDSSCSISFAKRAADTL